MLKRSRQRIYIIYTQKLLHDLGLYAIKIICEPRYNIPKNFPCGAIVKKKQTKKIYNLDTIAAAWLIAILS